VPQFLLSVARAAVAAATTASSSSSSSSSPPSLNADAISALARDAGLSASLQAAVVRAATTTTTTGGGGGGSEGHAVVGEKGGGGEVLGARRADLVRKVVGLEEGEACALVNGRRATQARERGGPTASDLSVAVEAADDLGEFLLEWALAWDWGAWPEGSPESSDPDLVNARLQSDVISQLASFLLRYHQEPRRTVPDLETLSTSLAKVLAQSSRHQHYRHQTGTDDHGGRSTPVRSIVGLGIDG
ncbi:unnamed protein product, partial [Laminaria digitata]